MLKWIKDKSDIILVVLVSVGFALFVYGCEPKEQSLLNKGMKVTRAELQFELDQLMSLAEIRMASFDRQEKIRSMILQNALMLTQGQPFNPIGILTGIATLYGITQATKKTSGVIKHVRDKRKANGNTT